MLKFIQDELNTRRDQSLYRSRRVVDGACGTRMRVDGRDVLSFCSNDYLGLANHPDVVDALCKGAQQYGVGSGAAHLISGHSRAHHELELELAAFTGRPRALLFSTGYMANLAMLAAFCGRHDTILQDRLNHASLLDAAQLSGAKLVRYTHADVADLERKLAVAKGLKWIVTDGVFSMDGDIAPLPEIAALAKQHDAVLMVDDAHGFGVLGDHGGGCVEYFRLSVDDVPLLMGTLGKAFGVFGAFIAGDDDFIEYLIQNARSYIYTTAMPPALAEAVRASLWIVRSDTWRREHLRRLIRLFKSEMRDRNIPLMDSSTPIQPVVVGSSESAIAMSNELLEQGFLVSAIRPPTVPQGTARLRVTLSAAHSDQEVVDLCNAIAIAYKNSISSVPRPEQL